jgi:hypothetical protein
MIIEHGYDNGGSVVPKCFSEIFSDSKCFHQVMDTQDFKQFAEAHKEFTGSSSQAALGPEKVHQQEKVGFLRRALGSGQQLRI